MSIWCYIKVTALKLMIILSDGHFIEIVKKIYISPGGQMVNGRDWGRVD